MAKENKITEVKCFAVGGNLKKFPDDINLTLYNEDENGNETDAVFIRLTQDELCMLLRALEVFEM